MNTTETLAPHYRELAASVVVKPGRGRWSGWSEIQAAHWPIVRVRTEEVDGRRMVRSLLIEGDDRPLTTDDFRFVSLAAVEKWMNHAELATHRTRAEQSLSVQPPGGRPYPQEFYANVARVYRELIMDGSAPAPAIAQMASVPQTTVHRWVRQARALGFLPTARNGRAG